MTRLTTAELTARVAEQADVIERLTRTSQQANSALNSERARNEEKLKDIGIRAMELAREHGWCETVQEALEELGVPIPNTRRRFKIVVEYEIEATYTGSDPDDADNESYISESVSFGYNGDGAPEMDEDWEDFEIVGARVDTVNDVEEIND